MASPPVAASVPVASPTFGWVASNVAPPPCAAWEDSSWTPPVAASNVTSSYVTPSSADRTSKSSLSAATFFRPTSASALKCCTLLSLVKSIVEYELISPVSELGHAS